MLLEVSDHLTDEIVDILHVLRSAVAVDLVLLPEADDNSSASAANDGATTGASELSDSTFINIGKHVLLLCHANSSRSRVAVVLSGGDGSGDLVDWNLLNASIELLQWVVVRGEIVALVSSGTPELTIFAVNSGTVGNIRNCPVVGIVVESVSNLLSIRVPVSHLSVLIYRQILKL